MLLYFFTCGLNIIQNILKISFAVSVRFLLVGYSVIDIARQNSARNDRKAGLTKK